MTVLVHMWHQHPDWAPQCLTELYPLCCLEWFCIVSALFLVPITVTPYMCLSFYSRNKFAADGGSVHLPALLQPDSLEVAASEADIFKSVS